MIHIFHKWGKWTAPIEVERYYNPEQTHVVQQRTCERCGLIDRRDLGGVER